MEYIAINPKVRKHKSDNNYAVEPIVKMRAVLCKSFKKHVTPNRRGHCGHIQEAVQLLEWVRSEYLKENVEIAMNLTSHIRHRKVNFKAIVGSPRSWGIN